MTDYFNDYRDWRKRLSSIRTFEDNWDGYGALPVFMDSVDMAWKFMEYVESLNIPIPFICANVDGEIDIVWDGEEDILPSIEFNFPYKDWVTYYVEYKRDDGEIYDFDETVTFDEAKEVLQKYMKHEKTKSLFVGKENDG